VNSTKTCFNLLSITDASLPSSSLGSSFYLKRGADKTNGFKPSWLWKISTTAPYLCINVSLLSWAVFALLICLWPADWLCADGRERCILLPRQFGDFIRGSAPSQWDRP